MFSISISTGVCLPYVFYFEYGSFISYDFEQMTLNFHCFKVYHYCWVSGSKLAALRYYQLIVFLNIFLPLLLAFLLCYLRIIHFLWTKCAESEGATANTTVLKDGALQKRKRVSQGDIEMDALYYRQARLLLCIFYCLFLYYDSAWKYFFSNCICYRYFIRLLCTNE